MAVAHRSVHRLPSGSHRVPRRARRRTTIAPGSSRARREYERLLEGADGSALRRARGASSGRAGHSAPARTRPGRRSGSTATSGSRRTSRRTRRTSRRASRVGRRRRRRRDGPLAHRERPRQRWLLPPPAGRDLRRRRVWHPDKGSGSRPSARDASAGRLRPGSPRDLVEAWLFHEAIPDVVVAPTARVSYAVTWPWPSRRTTPRRTSSG